MEENYCSLTSSLSFGPTNSVYIRSAPCVCGSQHHSKNTIFHTKYRGAYVSTYKLVSPSKIPADSTTYRLENGFLHETEHGKDHPIREPLRVIALGVGFNGLERHVARVHESKQTRHEDAEPLDKDASQQQQETDGENPD